MSPIFDKHRGYNFIIKKCPNKSVPCVHFENKETRVVAGRLFLHHDGSTEIKMYTVEKLTAEEEDYLKDRFGDRFYRAKAMSDWYNKNPKR